MPAIAAMVAYIGLFPIGLFTTQCCYAAQILNIIRKSGMPKMSIDYAQSIVFMDEFRALTYLMSIVMMPKGFFIHTPLLIGVALGLAVEFKKILDKKPNTPVLSTSMIKDWVVKGAAIEI